MAKPFSIFLAFKYLKPKRTFLSVVTVISVLGVLLGVAVLIIVLSVMSGFDDMWRDKILSFNAHLTVSSYGFIEAEGELLEQIESVEGVTGAAPYVQGLVFIQYHERIFTPFMRGVDPVYEPRVSKITNHIVQGSFSVEDDEVVIGRDLARRMGVGVGDEILVFSPQSFSQPDEIQLPEELTISGIFEVGMWDFDMGYAITSIDKARDLYGIEEGVHGIQVMTEQPYRANVVGNGVRRELGAGYTVQTWMDLNQQLFTALQVEKNMMFILLAIISVVAAFTVMNTLITMTVQKTKEIGLLKSLGFTKGHILRTFVAIGWIQALFGAISGVLTALLFLHYRNDIADLIARRFGIDLLPKELYHLDAIPATISWFDISMVLLTVWIMCTVAALIPAYIAASKNPSTSLRYE